MQTDARPPAGEPGARPEPRHRPASGARGLVADMTEGGHQLLAAATVSEPVRAHAVDVAHLLIQGAEALSAAGQQLAADAKLIAQLETALVSRVIIEQAKGMLAERLGCTPEAAFLCMRAYARSNNVKVHDLATRVLAADPAVMGMA